MVAWTVNTYGGLDVIFCNTGKVTSTAAQTILELDLSELDKVMPAGRAQQTTPCRRMQYCWGLMRCASQQMGVHGIRVNCVTPSGVFTPIAQEFGLATAGDMENFIGPFTSLKGVALTADHMAEAVLFLASDESAFVSGHNLVVDGGLVCFPFSK
ncbi:hypothetical protein BUALT_Bualt03G0209600 [Buddleja alternifolia]|uniref:Uncharacterized protein n=1 Tax=Buddleja alternifolia TaxID=168488 RepID=A0AAV6Y2T1_9LAMI|nr:hypothetical protein BUALT_Bualt03G0209600 [Buddleja alternifolia]